MRTFFMTSSSARLHLALSGALYGLFALLLTGCGGGNLVDRARNPFAGGCCAFIVFVLDVLALYELLQSNRDGSEKLIWGLVIFFLPVLGLILYYLFGRK